VYKNQNISMKVTWSCEPCR